jgi:hypothetical protein
MKAILISFPVHNRGWPHLAKGPVVGLSASAIRACDDAQNRGGRTSGGRPQSGASLGWARQVWGQLEGTALLPAALTGPFAGRIAMVSSFGAESAVLLDMVASIDRRTPVVFLETGKLFPETLVRHRRA